MNNATALEVLTCVLVGVAAAYGALTVFAVYPGALRFAPADAAAPAAARDDPEGHLELQTHRGALVDGPEKADAARRAESDESDDAAAPPSPEPRGAPFDAGLDSSETRAAHAAAECYDPELERVFASGAPRGRRKASRGDAAE